MLSKVLISCALLVAVQAYAPSANAVKPSNAGYAAQIQPASIMHVVKTQGQSYGAAPAHGGSSACGSANGIDPEVLRLAHLALSMPSAQSAGSGQGPAPAAY